MSQPTESLEPEPSLLDYARGRRLKNGGQGIVYQYINRQTGALYAVKVMEYNHEEHYSQERPQSEINMLRETCVTAFNTRRLPCHPVPFQRAKLNHRLTYFARMQSSSTKTALQSSCLTFSGVICDKILLA